MGARRPAYTVNNRLRGGGRQGTQAIRAISGNLQGLCGRKIGEAGKERQGRFWEKSEGRMVSRANQARRPRTQGRNNGRKGEDGG